MIQRWRSQATIAKRRLYTAPRRRPRYFSLFVGLIGSRASRLDRQIPSRPPSDPLCVPRVDVTR
eukprot:1423689-Pyramimonas_sp.AAC.1